MQENKWARLLAYVTGLVNQKLLLQNEYLAAESRILRSRFPRRMRFSDPERSTLAEIGKRIGRTALQQVACVAKPDTILAWYRRLIARKFNGSKHRASPGRPPIAREVEAAHCPHRQRELGLGIRPNCRSARSGHLLRAVFHPFRIAQDQPRRVDPASHGRMDATDGAQRDRREFRFSSRATVPSP